MPTKNKPFIPALDIVYLMGYGKYCVIKAPEPIPGETEPMVREGCTVFPDGRWYYWKLQKPVNYVKWCVEQAYNDGYKKTPDVVVKHILKTGTLPPVFKERHGDNNWKEGNPKVIPDYITDDMLGDLAVAHLQLSEEIREGKTK
jgi:hypothetical protein